MSDNMLGSTLQTAQFFNVDFRTPIGANDNHHPTFELNLNGIRGTAFQGFGAAGWLDEPDLSVVE